MAAQRGADSIRKNADKKAKQIVQEAIFRQINWLKRQG